MAVQQDTGLPVTKTPDAVLGAGREARAADGAGRPKLCKREKRRGGFRRTLASGMVMILAGAVAASFGTTFVTSLMRHLEYSRSVHPDGTVARVLGAVSGPQRDVGLVYRSEDGKVLRMLVERDAADRFVNDNIARIETARVSAKAEASKDLERMFAQGFSDADAAIETYADWFYAWKRSYVLLKEAVVSTVSHLSEIGEVEPLSVAVERDIKAYFLRHYSEQVLKPQMRDSVIASGMEQAARDVHERYLATLAESDLRLQLFLARTGRLVEQKKQDAAMTEVSLDWDAQRFQAPTYLMEDRAFGAVTGLGTIAVAGTIGSYALRPVMEAAAARGLAAFGDRAAGAMAARLALAEGGAATGVLTPIGPLGGAVVGGLIGLAVDYAVNEAGEALGREAFIAANRRALEATIETWHSAMEQSLHAAIDVWYDDARNATALERIAAVD